MLKTLFLHPQKNKKLLRPVVIVSGLPRSGTSMMMKMLADGGLEIVSDALRVADDDNPNGYFELEPVKQLAAGETAWLARAGGQVVKVISSLLEYLPREYNYKIIFMERELDEVLVSQQKMLRHRQEQSQVLDGEMRKQFEDHLAAVKYWLARQPNMDVLYVSYNRVLADPGAYAGRIAGFLGQPLDLDKMVSTPNPSLYRNRVQKT